MYNLIFHTNLDKYQFMNCTHTLFPGAPIPRKGEKVKVGKRDDVPFNELEVVAIKYDYNKSNFSEGTNVTVYVELHYSEQQFAEAKAYNISLF